MWNNLREICFPFLSHISQLGRGRYRSTFAPPTFILCQHHLNARVNNMIFVTEGSACGLIDYMTDPSLEQVHLASLKHDQFWRYCVQHLRTSYETSNSQQTYLIFAGDRGPACYEAFVGRGRINSSPLGQNGRLLADDILRCIFVNEKFCILVNISVKFALKGPIDKKHSIGLDNGWTPNRREAIIWTNADPIHWRIIAALGEMMQDKF